MRHVLSSALILACVSFTPAAADGLADAQSIAGGALGALQRDGWITGLPAKPLYETADGVPTLLYALLELAAYPDRLEPNL